MSSLESHISINRPSAFLASIFALCFAGNILGGVASTLLSVYLPEMTGSLNAQAGGMMKNWSAITNAAFFAGWAVGGIAWGKIGDNIGVGRALSLATAVFGGCTILIAYIDGWTSLFILRIITGFGVGGVLVLNTTWLSEIWPAKSRNIFIGILSIGFPIGIITSGLLKYFAAQWQDAFLIGFLPMLIAIPLYYFSTSTAITDTASSGRIVKLNDYRSILVHGIVVFGSMLIGLWAIFSWVPTWLQSLSAGTSQARGGLGMMILGAGGLAGGFVSGWVSRAIGTRRALLLSFLFCFVLSLSLFGLTSRISIITMAGLALLAFSFGISQGILSFYIPLLFPVSIRATATGLCFNAGRFFTAAAVFFVGAWVDFLGGYGNALTLFSIIFLPGFIFLFKSKQPST